MYLSFLDIYDLNRGFRCKQHYVPITSSRQDCKNAATSLGYTGESVAYLEYKDKAWSSSRPKGCFLSDKNIFYFNDGAGGNSIGNDHILCIRKDLGMYKICSNILCT